MSVVEISLSVPKEMNDIRILIVKLISEIKAKKPIAEIAAGSLPALMSAVEGWDQLDEEAKLKESYNLYGILVSDIAQALIAKPVVVAAL